VEAVIWVVVAVFGVGLAVGIRALVKRGHARFSSEGSIADLYVGEHGEFAFSVPVERSIGIYCEYSIEAVRQSAGISYGLRMRVDVERAGFEQRGEYLIGQAKRPFGEVALAHSLDGGPHLRNGLEIRRAMLLARVPAGEAVKVSGKVERTAGQNHFVHLYAKPMERA
jgi:hypothetical protein